MLSFPLNLWQTRHWYGSCGFYPANGDARRGSECCSPIGWPSPPSARSRGPTSPWCQDQRGFRLWLQLCLSHAGKIFFPVVSVHMQSIVVCRVQQQHLPLSAPMGCSLPRQPVMTQFPLTLVWLISNQALHWVFVFFFFPLEASWQLSRHGSVSQFPSHSTTAQLWSLACPSYR